MIGHPCEKAVERYSDDAKALGLGSFAGNLCEACTEGKYRKYPYCDDDVTNKDEKNKEKLVVASRDEFALRLNCPTSWSSAR